MTPTRDQLIARAIETGKAKTPEDAARVVDAYLAKKGTPAPAAETPKKATPKAPPKTTGAAAKPAAPVVTQATKPAPKPETPKPSPVVAAQAPDPPRGGRTVYGPMGDVRRADAAARPPINDVVQDYRETLRARGWQAPDVEDSTVRRAMTDPSWDKSMRRELGQSGKFVPDTASQEDVFRLYAADQKRQYRPEAPPPKPVMGELRRADEAAMRFMGDTPRTAPSAPATKTPDPAMAYMTPAPSEGPAMGPPAPPSRTRSPAARDAERALRAAGITGVDDATDDELVAAARNLGR